MCHFLIKKFKKINLHIIKLKFKKKPKKKKKNPLFLSVTAMASMVFLWLIAHLVTLFHYLPFSHIQANIHSPHETQR